MFILFSSLLCFILLSLSLSHSFRYTLFLSYFILLLVFYILRLSLYLYFLTLSFHPFLFSFVFLFLLLISLPSLYLPARVFYYVSSHCVRLYFLTRFSVVCNLFPCPPLPLLIQSTLQFLCFLYSLLLLSVLISPTCVFTRFFYFLPFPFFRSSLHFLSDFSIDFLLLPYSISFPSSLISSYCLSVPFLSISLHLFLLFLSIFFLILFFYFLPNSSVFLLFLLLTSPLHRLILLASSIDFLFFLYFSFLSSIRSYCLSVPFPSPLSFHSLLLLFPIPLLSIPYHSPVFTSCLL